MHLYMLEARKRERLLRGGSKTMTLQQVKELEKLQEENDKLKNAHDFNHLFAELEKDCKEKEVCNAFEYITLGELIDINELMDRFIVFVENADEEELEDMECGYEILELYRLVERLFTRYIKQDNS